MAGTPLQVCIALGLIISGCCDEPFRNQVITFSNRPEFYAIKGNSLQERVACLNRAAWDMNTDFIAVFKLILGKAREFKIPPENMPNRLYVFSDMQFDQASSGNFATNYDTVRSMYAEAGYQVPELVFWNLRGDTLDFPVGDANTPGVALVSGFTTAILKALLNGRNLSPVTVLQDALSGERYQPIRYLA